jgi:hypothetical protein
MMRKYLCQFCDIFCNSFVPPTLFGINKKREMICTTQRFGFPHLPLWMRQIKMN